MTQEEKTAVLLLAQTAERIMHENICMKAMFKTFCGQPEQLPDWKNWLSRMLDDKELQQPVHERFQSIYAQIEQSVDPSKALKALLRDFPVSGKEN